eukprot:328607_1
MAAVQTPIVEWLHANGLGAYEKKLIELQIQKEDLRLLENDDEVIAFCNDIGISNVIHKKKMQHAIKQLQLGMSTNAVVITKEIQDILCNMRELSSQLIRMEKEASSHKQLIEEAANKCASSIEQHFDSLIASLQNRKNELLKQLDVLKATKINQSSAIHENITNHKTQTHTKQLELAQLVTNSNANEQAIKAKYEDFVQSNESKEVQRIMIDNHIKFSFVCDSKFDENVGQYGAVSLDDTECKQSNNTPVKPIVQESPHNIFDEVYNKDGYYSLSNNKKKAVIAKSGSYPVCRISKAIDINDIKSQTVKFKMCEYGWFGIGNSKVATNKFPGYTKFGWMIRISDGGSYSNNVHNAVGSHQTGDMTNKVISIKYVPDTKQLTVTVPDGQEFVYSNQEMPGTNEGYFVFSKCNGSVEILD